MELADIIDRIVPPDEAACAAAHKKWACVAKPLGSLGALEEAVERLAGVQGTPEVEVAPRCVAVMCADNGVVAQGVTQTGPEVTAKVAAHIARGTSSVCVMAKAARADVFPYDVGMLTEVPGVPTLKVARGTRSIACGPAMGRGEAIACVEAGARVAADLAGQGYRLVGAGEMGIGNTTTAAAMACALTGISAQAAVGRGAGLSKDGLARKVAAVAGALEVNAFDAADPLDVLSKLGGFDIAAMAGLFLGCAASRTMAVVDGFISSVAALTAQRICPASRHYMLASHRSAEPGAAAVMEELGLRPVVDAGMRLGEGTGAVCLFPLLDMACALYRDGMSFAEYDMDAYRELP